MTDLQGNIHSIESCGTVDGPGVRFVVFFQGCLMRCLYCHNPDTWDFNINKKMTVSQILEQYDGVKEYLKNGGLTATGGEPMSQIHFLTELFKQARQKNIHTTLDTSGVVFDINDTEKFDKLIQYTNLVILDIKHIDNNEHIKLTGHPNTPVLNFAKYLSNKKIPVWIRHVVIPNVTYNQNYFMRLAEFLSTLNNIQALDILPYHNMAIPKYEKLGKPYPLKAIPPATKEQAQQARNFILKCMQRAKMNQTRQIN